MKSELIHLLTKLKLDHPDFQNLILTPNGVAMACLQHGYKRFENLDALEAYAWPQDVGSSPATAGLAPSAQDAARLAKSAASALSNPAL